MPNSGLFVSAFLATGDHHAKRPKSRRSLFVHNDVASTEESNSQKRIYAHGAK